MIYYVSGGERSGKSSFAQRLAESLSEAPIYIATARIWDENFQKRIDRHISDRGNQWTTIEEEKWISSVISEKQTVVIDCITLWITNFFIDSKYDVEESLQLIKKEIRKVLKINANVIIISNEIGMGLHPTTESGRKFTELQGWTNQFIAEHAHKAYFMVSGLPLTLK